MYEERNTTDMRVYESSKYRHDCGCPMKDGLPHIQSPTPSLLRFIHWPRSLAQPADSILDLCGPRISQPEAINYILPNDRRTDRQCRANPSCSPSAEASIRSLIYQQPVTSGTCSSIYNYENCNKIQLIAHPNKTNVACQQQNKVGQNHWGLH